MSQRDNSQEQPEEKVLVCPLLSLRPEPRDCSAREQQARMVAEAGIRPNDCLRRACAWWDKQSSCCAVLKIARATD